MDYPLEDGKDGLRSFLSTLKLVILGDYIWIYGDRAVTVKSLYGKKSFVVH